jgi:hypothetical protein
VGNESTSQVTRFWVKKQIRERTLLFWHKYMLNMRGGNAWIKHAAFVAIDAQAFHPIVLALARTLVNVQLPHRPYTQFIFGLLASYAAQRVRRMLPVDDHVSCGSIPRHLKLELE